MLFLILIKVRLSSGLFNSRRPANLLYLVVSLQVIYLRKIYIVKFVVTSPPAQSPFQNNFFGSNTI
jgi:hypothetical protein